MVKRTCQKGTSTGYKITIIIEGPEKDRVDKSLSFLERYLGTAMRMFPQPDKERKAPCGCSGS